MRVYVCMYARVCVCVCMHAIWVSMCRHGVTLWDMHTCTGTLVYVRVYVCMYIHTCEIRFCCHDGQRLAVANAFPSQPSQVHAHGSKIATHPYTYIHTYGFVSIALHTYIHS